MSTLKFTLLLPFLMLPSASALYATDGEKEQLPQEESISREEEKIYPITPIRFAVRSALAYLSICSAVSSEEQFPFGMVYNIIQCSVDLLLRMLSFYAYKKGWSEYKEAYYTHALFRNFIFYFISAVLEKITDKPFFTQFTTTKIFDAGLIRALFAIGYWAVGYCMLDCTLAFIDHYVVAWFIPYAPVQEVAPLQEEGSAPTTTP